MITNRYHIARTIKTTKYNTYLLDGIREGLGEKHRDSIALDVCSIGIEASGVVGVV